MNIKLTLAAALLLTATPVLAQSAKSEDAKTKAGASSNSKMTVVSRESADGDDGQEQPRDVQGPADQGAGRANDVPVEAERRGIGSRWGGGDEMAGDSADDRHRQHRHCCPFGMKTAVGPLEDEHSAQEGAAEYADIGAGLDQAGPAQDFVRAEVLRQDRIFDRAEEGRMHAHRAQRREQ